MEKKENIPEIIFVSLIYSLVIIFITTVLYKTYIRSVSCENFLKDDCKYNTITEQGLPLPVTENYHYSKEPDLSKYLGDIKKVYWQNLFVDLLFWFSIVLVLINATDYFFKRRKNNGTSRKN